MTYKSYWGGTNFTPRLTTPSSEKHTYIHAKSCKIPKRPSCGSPSPHNPTTSPQSSNLLPPPPPPICWLPHRFARTWFVLRIQMYTPRQTQARPLVQRSSDFYPKVSSLFTSQFGRSAGSRPAAAHRDLCRSIHQPQVLGSGAAHPPAISITSISLEHNSLLLLSSALSFSFHLLQSVKVNYISLCEVAPSITRWDRQAQVS